MGQFLDEILTVKTRNKFSIISFAGLFLDFLDWQLNNVFVQQFEHPMECY